MTGLPEGVAFRSRPLPRPQTTQGFEVLLIDFREDRELVRRTVKERGYTARVLLDESGDVTGKAYGVWGPPTAYFIDRAGRLTGRAVGPRNWDTPAARQFVGELLKQDASGPATR